MRKRSDGTKIPCICVTNRQLCRDDFLERLEWIARSGKADALLLREKDLSETQYGELAEEVLRICKRYSVTGILHTFYRVAEELGCPNIHLPLGILSQMPEQDKSRFERIGSSVHAVCEAEEAVRLGVSYVTAGHVFSTDCKKGLPGRGLPFIREVSHAVTVPVFGIGGIQAENASGVVEAGAYGVCIMSGFMLESREGLC